jgi:hypothetical protein
MHKSRRAISAATRLATAVVSGILRVVFSASTIATEPSNPSISVMIFKLLAFKIWFVLLGFDIIVKKVHPPATPLR